MRILVYPHSLGIGGIQIRAIDMAGALRELGHETLVLAPAGPLKDVASERGIPVIEQPPPGKRPSLRAVRTIRRVARAERIDLVHSYSHSASLEAFFAAYVLGGIPVIAFRGGIALPEPFPAAIPLVVNNPVLGQEAHRLGRTRVVAQRVAVDTSAYSPSGDGKEFLQTIGIDQSRFVLVLVSRLVSHLKLEGLGRAIRVMGELAHESPMTLVIVCGGPRYTELLQRADALNRRVGEPLVILTGPMLDPRPAFDAADVVLGMGGSVLRGMSFAKPAVVLGERGFSEIVSPDTIHTFLDNGFYGVGTSGDGDTRLAGHLRRLLRDDVLRQELGSFARQVTCEWFSLRSAAQAVDSLSREVTARDLTWGHRFQAGCRFVGHILLRRTHLILAGRTQRAAQKEPGVGQ